MKGIRNMGAMLMLASGISVPGHAAEVQVPLAEGTYEVAVQTVLPHLEENLRYATERDRRCLGTQNAARLFPVLEHPSFKGCRLTGTDSDLQFNIQCQNPEAASGTATFDIDPQRFSGTLDIKMGGKNMRFTQIVTGRRTGECAQQ